MTLAALELILPDGQEAPLARHGAAGHLPLEIELERYITHAQRFLKRQVRQMGPAATLYTVAEALDTLWARYRPVWTRNLTPWAMASYVRGMVGAASGHAVSHIPEETLLPLATQYVASMGDYFAESSKEAVLAGFNSYLNRRLAPQMAAKLVTEGYGLTKRQMNSMVKSDNLDNLIVQSSQSRDVRKTKKSFISRMLKGRFTKFAEEETFTAEQHAKQLLWLFMDQNGNLPQGAERQWITADDEKVCKRCGPLHGKRVPINEPFYLKGEKEPIWTPGLHVNCRCSVRLYVPPSEIFGKADFDESEVVRDTRGRFAFEGNKKKDPFLGERDELAEKIAETERETLRRRIRETPVEKPQAQGPLPQAKGPVPQASLIPGLPQASLPQASLPQASRPQAKVPAMSSAKRQANYRQMQANRRQMEADIKVESYMALQDILHRRKVPTTALDLPPEPVRTPEAATPNKPDYFHLYVPVGYAERINTPKERSALLWNKFDGQDYVTFKSDAGSIFGDPEEARANAVQMLLDTQLVNRSLMEFPIDFELHVAAGINFRPEDTGVFIVNEEDLMEADADMVRDLLNDLQIALNVGDTEALKATYNLPGVHADYMGLAHTDDGEFTGWDIAEAAGLESEEIEEEMVYIFTTQIKDSRSDITEGTKYGQAGGTLKGTYKAHRVSGPNGIIFVELEEPDDDYWQFVSEDDR